MIHGTDLIFVGTSFTKAQFFSVFSAHIYSAHKVARNLQKKNTFRIGKTYFKEQNVGEIGSTQMVLCRNLLLPWHLATWFSKARWCSERTRQNLHRAREGFLLWTVKSYHKVYLHSLLKYFSWQINLSKIITAGSFLLCVTSALGWQNGGFSPDAELPKQPCAALASLPSQVDLCL